MRELVFILNATPLLFDHVCVYKTVLEIKQLSKIKKIFNFIINDAYQR
jgi:hypothetical protein